MNALRLLSATVNGCYEKAFMSVQPSSAGLNAGVAHSPLRRAQCAPSITGAMAAHTYVHELPNVSYAIRLKGSKYRTVSAGTWKWAPELRIQTPIAKV